MSDDMAPQQREEQPGQHGAAARAGIVDQQDALLAEVEAQRDEGDDRSQQ